MTRFDSIVVGNDLVSEHWLTEQFPAAVAAMRGGLEGAEEFGKITSRSGLTALASQFGDLVEAREQDDDARLKRTARGRPAALLLPVTRSHGRRARRHCDRRCRSRTPSGVPPLLALQAHDATTVEDLLDGEGAGRLLTSATVDGKTEPVTARAISALPHRRSLRCFCARHGRRLAAAGRAGALAGGPWLAVDLATACERRDTSARGELETIAALVSGDVLLLLRTAPCRSWC